MHCDIWLFNQINGDGVPKVPNNQNPVYVQYERDYIGRELHNAIRKFAEYLGYFPAPTWITEDLPINCDLHWTRQTLSARYGYLQAFGRRTTSIIQSNAAVTYSDTNGDNVQDTGTITIPSGVANIPADEIHLFFKVADGAPSAAHEYWEIEPLNVVKNGDAATVTAHKALFTHPLNVWSKERSSSDWTTLHHGDIGQASSFVTQVDVYRVSNSATDAVQLVSQDTTGAQELTSVSATIQDDRLGDFRLYQATGQETPPGQPRTVRVSYLAGLPLVNGEMDSDLAVAITRYANLLFPQQPAMVDRTIAMWNEDRQQRALTGYDAWHPPPLGVTNAGMDAWTVIEARYIPLKGKATYGRP